MYADSAYTDYVIEDLLDDALQILLLPLRKSNSKRPVPAQIHFVRTQQSERVETTGRLIERLLPLHIHAVTAKGIRIETLAIRASLQCRLPVGHNLD